MKVVRPSWFQASRNKMHMVELTAKAFDVVMVTVRKYGSEISLDFHTKLHYLITPALT